MIISIRTFINTTFFRILLIVGFWLYSKYDDTPAKQFIHFIGRDNLGNLTVSLESRPLSEQIISEKLANIEQICAKSVRLYMYDQVPVSPVPAYNYVNLPAISTPPPTTTTNTSTPNENKPSTNTIDTTKNTNTTILTGNIPIIENKFNTTRS